PRLRQEWIMQRGDVEQTEIGSEYGKQRMNDKSLDALRFEHIQKPFKAKAGKNVSQLHYAKQGIITPEMEYIAIRENQRIDEVKQSNLCAQHAGHSFGANTPKKLITPEFV